MTTTFSITSFLWLIAVVIIIIIAIIKDKGGKDD